MIRITSKQHNFRRCGIPHPKDPVEYPNSRFTKKELAILEAEPMLTVVRVQASQSEDSEKEKTGEDSADQNKED